MENIFTTSISGEDFEKLRQLFQYAYKHYEAELLDNADMKLLFKVCDKTLYRWRKQEHLLYYKIGGKFYYPKKILFATLYQRLLNQYPQHQLPKLFWRTYNLSLFPLYFIVLSPKRSFKISFNAASL